MDKKTPPPHPDNCPCCGTPSNQGIDAYREKLARLKQNPDKKLPDQKETKQHPLPETE